MGASAVRWTKSAQQDDMTVISSQSSNLEVVIELLCMKMAPHFFEVLSSGPTKGGFA